MSVETLALSGNELKSCKSRISNSFPSLPKTTMDCLECGGYCKFKRLYFNWLSAKEVLKCVKGWKNMGVAPRNVKVAPQSGKIAPQNAKVARKFENSHLIGPKSHLK